MKLIFHFYSLRFGRRRLTLISLMGCVIGLIIFGLSFRKLAVSLTVKLKVNPPDEYAGPTCKNMWVFENSSWSW